MSLYYFEVGQPVSQHLVEAVVEVLPFLFLFQNLHLALIAISRDYMWDKKPNFQAIKSCHNDIMILPEKGNDTKRGHLIQL